MRDPDQDKAKRKSCQNEVGCFESLITWAEAFSGLPRQSLAFVIEPTNIYHEQLVQFLHTLLATVYLVNPGRVRKLAEGIGIPSKNDVIDADLLARYGLMAKKLTVYPGTLCRNQGTTGSSIAWYGRPSGCRRSQAEYWISFVVWDLLVEAGFRNDSFGYSRKQAGR